MKMYIWSHIIKSTITVIYMFLQLTPGRYELRVNASGFAPLVKSGVVLLVNTPATLEVKMSVQRVESTELVTAEPSGVNHNDASLGNAFDSSQIEMIPAEGRNAVELLSLQPGVAYLGDNVNTGADSRSGAVNGVSRLPSRCRGRMNPVKPDSVIPPSHRFFQLADRFRYLENSPSLPSPLASSAICPCSCRNCSVRARGRRAGGIANRREPARAGN